MCGLDLPSDPNLLIGPEHADDAGVYRLNADTALIQTLDFFTPIVDDPHDFGRIAAANALSDVYAMGGRPLLCMNILACPGKGMDPSIFRRVVEGGLEKIREAGALLVGGHSIEDKELKYGLSVTGVAHPDHVLSNGGARSGDVLVLTKALGTGILTTGLKGGLVNAETAREMVELMATLNRLPVDILQENEELRMATHGCTDITGFGLLGHAREMAAASQVSLHVNMQDLPVLDGLDELVSMGIIPEGAYRNQSYYRKWLRSSLDETSNLMMIACDPQTSGGLLLAMEEQAARQLIKMLQEGQYAPACAIIGRVEAEQAGYVFLC